MALASVLSALRTFILDAPELPSEQSAREVWLTRNIAGITAEEARDLAKIPPAKIRVYTESIFTAQSKIMKGYFPRTFAILESEWQAFRGERFSAMGLLMEMHKVSPWHSTKTLDLAANLTKFIENHLSDIGQRRPEIRSWMRREELNLKIRKGGDDAVSPRCWLKSDDLAGLSVEALLETRCFVPLNAQFTQFSPGTIQLGAREEFAVGSRDRRYRVRWTPLDRPVWDYVSGLTRGAWNTVGNLAQVYVENAGAEGEEEFKRFIAMLAQLVDNGAVALVGDERR